jgi:transcriptional antiterminator
MLFEKEYKIAETAYKDIKEKVGYEINEDEIGFIALHIHSAIVENATNVENLLRITNLLQIYISRIEKDRDVVILRNNIFYMRLLTHIKYLLLRIEKGEELDMSLNEFVNNSFAYSFEIAEEFCSEISKILGHKIDESEIGYLAIHIERITKDYKTENSD